MIGCLNEYVFVCQVVEAEVVEVRRRLCKTVAREIKDPKSRFSVPPRINRSKPKRLLSWSEIVRCISACDTAS